jgi:2-phosphosulfolactate phosphatase
MELSLEVTFTPADFDALRDRDLSRTVCVVFDVLRATTSMTTALANGAAQVLPVREISQALGLKARHPDALLAGERHGARIRADQTGGVDFDLGNSPREFTPERVRGRTIIMSTTNGTRALQACAGAKRVFAGSLVGFGALVATLRTEPSASVVVVGAGTFEEAAYEDTLAAGMLCDALWERFAESQIVDSARIARDIYHSRRADILGALSHARNGRRLLEKPDLRDDVAFCARLNVCQIAAELRDGALRGSAVDSAR